VGCEVLGYVPGFGQGLIVYLDCRCLNGIRCESDPEIDRLRRLTFPKGETFLSSGGAALVAVL
jgi:hypothetical protein